MPLYYKNVEKMLIILMQGKLSGFFRTKARATLVKISIARLGLRLDSVVSCFFVRFFRRASRRVLSRSSGKGSRKRRQFRITFKVLSYLLKLAGFGAIWAALSAFGVILWFGYNLPDVGELAITQRQPGITILDQKGNVLSAYGNLYGRVVQAEELPRHVVNALIATEDRRFYGHFGVDPIGIARAFMKNVQSGNVVQGGSTITQQLAFNFLQSKKMFGPYERSFQRKVSEALLALAIERRFTKSQILTMYLNRVYMGAGTYGIDAAALRYFGHHAEELNLYESAVLIGLLKGPSKYSPANNPERSEGRAKQVLMVMEEQGFITKDDMEAALTMPTPIDERLQKDSVHYFADWVRDSIPNFVDITDEDLEVVTTIDLSLQKIAEQQALRTITTVARPWRAEQAAVVTMAPDGAVLAMVGGLDYRRSKFNRATQALRQPGSSFKFFVYTAALKCGYSPNSLISDALFESDGWAPGNYKYRSQGQISLREAFAKSVNSSAARLGSYVGIRKIIKTCRDLGITTPIPHELGISLGGLEATLIEMTGAYATIANQGNKVIPHGILLIRTKGGKVLYRWKPPVQEVLSKTVVKGMHHMMRKVVEYGTGRRAAIPDQVIAGKSGSSQKHADKWFIAMTPELVTGVWVGRDNARPMKNAKNGSPAVHLWKAFMERVIQYQKNPAKYAEKEEDERRAHAERMVELLLEDSDKTDDDDDDDDDGDGDDDDNEQPKRRAHDDDDDNDDDNDRDDEPDTRPLARPLVVPPHNPVYRPAPVVPRPWGPAIGPAPLLPPGGRYAPPQRTPPPTYRPGIQQRLPSVPQRAPIPRTHPQNPTSPRPQYGHPYQKNPPIP